MTFELMAFCDADKLQCFIQAAQHHNSNGITIEILAPNVLVVYYPEDIEVNVLERFRSVGFRAVCDVWAPFWHETNELLREHIEGLASNHQAFLTSFRGTQIVVIAQDQDE